jgi:hypothetical protein
MRITLRMPGDKLKKASFMLAAVLVTAALPLPALASVSIAGGGVVRNNPSETDLAGIVSSGASIPAVPLEIQGSLLALLSGKGGYAATAEIRGFTGGGYGGAYIGAGVGIGTLSNDGSSGTVLTLFAGKSIAPLTSIEFRLYKQTQAQGATAGFAGVRFSF